MKHPTLVFDVGGTLLRFNVEKITRLYVDVAKTHGVALDPAHVQATLLALERELPTRYQRRKLSLEADLGKTFWEDYYAEGFRRLSVDGDLTQEVAQIREMFMRGEFETLHADVVPALAVLAARSIPLGILSNFSPNLESILRQLGIHTYFDFFVVSGIVGIEKPDPKIFDLAVRAAKRDRADVIYIGDSIFHDIQGAQGAGVAAILIDRANQHKHHAGVRIERLTELIPLLEKEFDAIQA